MRNKNVKRFTNYISYGKHFIEIFNIVYENEILEIVKSLKTKQSCDKNNVSTALLKKCIYFI